MRSQVQQDPRIKRRLPCDISFNGAHYTGIVLDVSRRGLFIQTSVAAQPGSDVAIDLNGPSGENVEVDARVVWKRVVPSELMRVARGGVGLQIRRASESYYAFLRSIVDWQDSPPSGGSSLTRYDVRLKVVGRPRTRAVTVFARSEDAAGRQALQRVGDGWSVIEIEGHSGD